jgi:UrcA family protein
MMCKPFCGLGLCALLATSFPALADDTVSVRVNYADLGVQSSAGAATLRARINSAVDQICGSRQTLDLGRLVAVDRCRAAVTPSFDSAMETILTEQAKKTQLARKNP